jgi:dihydropteroate synthase
VKDTYLVDNYSIKCKGNNIDLSTPKIMSIINTTPDSFYDGGSNNSLTKILHKIEIDIQEGASIFDIGGYSSKPNADFVSEKEEINRTTNTIKEIVKRFPNINISIDTFRGKVAAHAIEAGAGIINDISGFNIDDSMLGTISKYKPSYILMHMQGTPKTMQNKPIYNDIFEEVHSFMLEKITVLKKININDIIIDPGFGFGKTVQHNYELFNNLSRFKSLKKPILVGISRKSMINKVLEIKPLNSLNGTTALNMIALSNGANILRVHDVKEAMECIKLNIEILNNK